MSTKVLVIDDEPDLLRALRINLRARGYAVEVASTGADGLRIAGQFLPDLVILDLGLPDLDGTEVLGGLRGWTDIPVLVLSGRTGSTDKVSALDAGADDYVIKPFGMEELLARMRALLRRTAPSDIAGRPVVRFGDVEVDLAAHLLTRTSGGEVLPAEPVHLTPTEWHLLEAFLRHPGKLLSKRQLLTEVWGSAQLTQEPNLRVYVAQLRRKIEPDPTRPRFLLNEPGMGYRFQPDRSHD